jgi:hypothetical protein
MGRKHIIKKKELLEAIKGSYGIMSTVAARLHCDWHTADDAIKRFPEALHAMADEGESVLDFTEGKAIERIRDGDGVMIRFMLATKGKKRGYTYDETTATAEAAIADTEVNISVNGGEPAPAEADA